MLGNILFHSQNLQRVCLMTLLCPKTLLNCPSFHPLMKLSFLILNEIDTLVRCHFFPSGNFILCEANSDENGDNLQ